MKNILDIGKKLGMTDEDLECYGRNKAKISQEYIEKT